MNPSTSGLSENDKYATVSSLYGPGTICCWYLTALSVFISWAIHARKRISDSLDVDALAVLTLPIVASADFLVQARSLSRRDEPNIPVQDVAAIQAPLFVVLAFTKISVVLFLTGATPQSIWRASAVEFVAFLCLAVDSYALRSNFATQVLNVGIHSDKSPLSASDRNIVVNFKTVIRAVVVILAARGPVAVVLGSLKRPKSQNRVRAPRIKGQLLSKTTWMSMMALMVESSIPSPTSIERFLVPKTACSIADLDQAVAAAAGALTLAFTIYDTARAYLEDKQVHGTGFRGSDSPASMADSRDEHYYGDEMSAHV